MIRKAASGLPKRLLRGNAAGPPAIQSAQWERVMTRW